MERGAIRMPAYRQQLADFTQLRWGKITPTDLDGFIDFSDKLFVFIEGKHGKATMPYGQELALQRLCDACHGKDRSAVAFVVNHDTPQHVAIDYASALVTKYRWNGAWHSPKDGGASLLHGIERIRRIVFPKPVADHAEWIAAYESVEHA